MTAGLLGWVATTVFATSYLFRQAAVLRRIQGAAACLWIIYGVATGAAPVVAANLIVAAAAIYSSLRRSSTSADREARADQQAEEGAAQEKVN